LAEIVPLSAETGNEHTKGGLKLLTRKKVAHGLEEQICAWIISTRLSISHHVKS